MQVVIPIGLLQCATGDARPRSRYMIYPYQRILCALIDITLKKNEMISYTWKGWKLHLQIKAITGQRQMTKWPVSCTNKHHKNTFEINSTSLATLLVHNFVDY